MGIMSYKKTRAFALVLVAPEFQPHRSVSHRPSQQDFLPSHQLFDVARSVSPEAPGDALADNVRFLHQHQIVVVGIELVDHIIVGHGSSTSLKEMGIL